MPDRNGSPAGQSIRFDVDAFTRPSPTERALIYQQLVPLGELHLRSVRIIETGEDGSALDLAAMGSRRNQWIVHEGGAP